MSVVCCSKEKDDQKIDLLFSPDSTMIGTEMKIPGTNSSLNFPKNYVDLNEYIPQLAGKSPEDLKVLALFGDIQKKHFCFISEIVSKTEVNDSIPYFEFLENRTTGDFKYGTFEHNELHFNQLRITEKDKIIFSLWHKLELNRILKYDYILSLPVNEIDVKAVESSISTIKKK